MNQNHGRGWGRKTGEPFIFSIRFLIPCAQASQCMWTVSTAVITFGCGRSGRNREKCYEIRSVDQGKNRLRNITRVDDWLLPFSPPPWASPLPSSPLSSPASSAAVASAARPSSRSSSGSAPPPSSGPQPPFSPSPPPCASCCPSLHPPPLKNKTHLYSNLTQKGKQTFKK